LHNARADSLTHATITCYSPLVCAFISRLQSDRAVDCFSPHPHNFDMRTIIIYVIGATAFLAILGYCVHMFIGGLVSPAVEHTATAVVVGLGAIAIFWMTWNILHRR